MHLAAIIRRPLNKVTVALRQIPKRLPHPFTNPRRRNKLSHPGSAATLGPGSCGHRTGSLDATCLLKPKYRVQGRGAGRGGRL